MKRERNGKASFSIWSEESEKRFITFAHTESVDIGPASLSVSASGALENTTGELVIGDAKKAYISSRP